MQEKPKEPFNAEREQESYNQFLETESTVKYKGQDIVVEYKNLKKTKKDLIENQNNAEKMK